MAKGKMYGESSHHMDSYNYDRENAIDYVMNDVTHGQPVYMQRDKEYIQVHIGGQKQMMAINQPVTRS